MRLAASLCTSAARAELITRRSTPLLVLLLAVCGVLLSEDHARQILVLRTLKATEKRQIVVLAVYTRTFLYKHFIDALIILSIIQCSHSFTSDRVTAKEASLQVFAPVMCMKSDTKHV
jgi:hypothetical protein